MNRVDHQSVQKDLPKNLEKVHDELLIKKQMIGIDDQLDYAREIFMQN